MADATTPNARIHNKVVGIEACRPVSTVGTETCSSIACSNTSVATTPGSSCGMPRLVNATPDTRNGAATNKVRRRTHSRRERIFMMLYSFDPSQNRLSPVPVTNSLTTTHRRRRPWSLNPFPSSRRSSAGATGIWLGAGRLPSDMGACGSSPEARSMSESRC